MNVHAMSFKTFFKEYSDQIQDHDCISTTFEMLDQIPLLPSQAIYVVDWKEVKITYQRGIQNLLDYSPEEFDHDLLMQFYHPDDIERYVNLVKISNEWARKLKPKPFSLESIIDYRLRKKDGTYLKVMRQSTVYESCTDGSIKSTFSILTNISQIKLNASVNMSLIQKGTGKVLLEDKDKASFDVEFSSREKEILTKLKTGMDSKSIANDLFISRHTVDTHRRKMLAKAKCRNVMELISCATMVGVV